MRRMALVTCEQLPVADDDQALIDGALHDLGVRDQVDWVAWNGDADWPGYDLAWIRTPWDYAENYAEFLSWLDRIEGEITVVNPVSVLRWNSHKRYLLDLERAGVPIVPTVVLHQPTLDDLEDVLHRQGWREAVVKPAVSVGAIGASRISAGVATNVAALAEAVGEGGGDGDVLVQPFVAGVADGEVSIVVLDGEVSHAVRKVPATGDFRVHEYYGGSVVAHDPTPAELALAIAAVAAVPMVATPVVAVPVVAEPASEEVLLYARVDCVTDDAGAPRLMELELIEPSLFLPFAPEGGVERLLRGVLARLDAS